ncbi:MAG: zinc-binding metallopeptidase family protein [Acidiferrobacterales bacterium]
MKIFHCYCGNTVYFENTRCFACNRELGFLPDKGALVALEPAAEALWRPLPPGAGLYRKCDHFRLENGCNWMLEESDPQSLCRACRLNRVIPDLGLPHNRVRWARIETAKRRLLFDLSRLGLTVLGRNEDPQSGLAFDFREDADPGVEFSDSIAPAQRVFTGYGNGLITINLAEADSGVREQTRERMNERYRTLLGHFRHEIGHYYFEHLVRDVPELTEFRELFGDERRDYGQALQAYYANGPLSGWEQSWISAYASAHPWEDWAETWAHYLHIAATLELAHDHEFVAESRQSRALTQAGDAYGQKARDYRIIDGTLAEALGDWTRLTVVLNDLNRSMGMPDAYPFVLAGHVISKLDFVHRIVTAAARV